MNNCSRCEALVDQEHLPEAECHSYSPGDIIGIQDSVHVPIHDHVLNNRRGSNISTGSRVWVDRGRGGRPAIVLERRPIESQDGSEETVVLLLATYEGDYRLRGHLPEVLQIFCIAVYPHSTIAEDEAGMFHLHTSPEWYHSRKDAEDLHGWLIARQFTSTRMTTGRWKNVHRSDPNSQSTFTIDHTTRVKLAQIIEQKWDDWVADCEEDPQRLYKYREDYKKFRDKVLKYSAPSSPSRTRNPTPIARSPPARSPTAQSPPPRTARVWTPRSPNADTSSSFAQPSGRALQQDITNPMSKPLAAAGNGHARPAAQPTWYPKPAACLASVPVSVAASSSTGPRISVPQSAWPGLRAAPVGNGDAVPSRPRPTSTAASPPVAVVTQVRLGRSTARPAQPPSYAQVIRENQQAARGAGTGQRRPPYN